MLGCAIFYQMRMIFTFALYLTEQTKRETIYHLCFTTSRLGLATKIQLCLQTVYDMDTHFVNWINETCSPKTKLMTECW